MKAIVKTKNYIELKEVAPPQIISRGDVIIAVKCAGFCRSDLFAGRGILPCAEGTTLGHEFSGVIESVGADVERLSVGDRVAVFPVISCGKCVFCKTNHRDRCQNRSILGMTRDGAFAEMVLVPQNIVYALPENLSFKHGAYSEPVAAALSVLKSGITQEEKGVIYGCNRFGKLIARILRAHDFNNVFVYDENGDESVEENAYDYAIETLADEAVMSVLFKAVKPGGRIVIKSRQVELIGINFNDAVQKELNICAVNYGNFGEAINLMSKKLIEVDDLFGSVHRLGDFKSVFDVDESFDLKKIFFEMG